MEKKARFWLESYGIEPAFDVYRSDLAVFQWPRVERHRRSVTGHLLIVCREKYLAQIALLAVRLRGRVGILRWPVARVAVTPESRT
jgi:hypothetical protein